MAKNDIEKIIDLAESQLGNGATKYRTWFYGYDAEDVAWCAIFVSWVFANAGIKMIKTDGAGCFAREGNGIYGKWYESEYSDNSTTPRKGDIITFVWNYSGRYYSQDKYYSDHVGIVYAVDSNYIYTVEGNAGASNDTSSVKLKSYSRTNGCINGYFRLNEFMSGNTESEENYMEIEKGNKNNFVLAYKSMLIQAKALGIISQTVDESSGFGEGTYKATIEVQKKFNLDVDGIAGVQTITALRNAINAATDKLKNTKSDRNAVLDEVAAAINKLKVEAV